MREHFAHDIGQRLVGKLRKRDPARAGRRRRLRRNLGGIDDELQREMREPVGNDAWPAPPFRSQPIGG